MRITRFVRSALIALLVIAISGNSAGARAQSTVSGADITTELESYIGMDRGFGPLTEGALQDLSGLAARSGITLSEAIDAYGWHESFSKLVSELRTRWPDEVAGARIEVQYARPWIAFRGRIPADAERLVAGFPKKILVYENRGFSEAELVEHLTNAHYAILAQRHLVKTASSGYDVSTGAITIRVELVASANSGSRASSLSALMKALPRDGDVRPITIEIVDEVHAGQDVIYGGGSLTTCTAGFTVVGAITRGISTAGHCGNTQSYEGRSLRFINEHIGSSGDLQWHTRDGESHVNQFYYQPGLRRFVYATGAAVEGQGLCRYGKTTGYRCDFVYQLNHCNGSACGLVAMQNDQASPGDSGGPWFYDTTAYGIHQGWKYWFGYRDLYTPVVYLPRALGVSVATS
jgi:hypothetical protein